MGDLFYQGDAGFSMLNNKTKISLSKSQLNRLTKYKLDFYLKTNDGIIAGNGKIVTAKVIKTSFLSIADIMSSNSISREDRPDKTIISFSGGKRLNLVKSSGPKRIVDNDGNMKVTKNPSNWQQEAALVLCLNKGRMLSHSEINKEIKFDFDSSWYNSFGKSFDKLSNLVNLSQYITYLDSAHNNPIYINKMTDSKILPDAKDNWNPSDIWIVKKSKKATISSSILKLHKQIIAGTSSIYDLNLYMVEQFNEKNLFGVSLKKISSAAGKLDKIIIDANIIKSVKFKNITKKYIFSCSNSYFDVFITMMVSAKPYDYRVRFRPKAATGQIRIYGEGRPVDAKVFDGAISSVMLKKTYPKQDLYLGFVVSHKTKSNVLSTVESFDDMKEQNEFLKYIKGNTKFFKITEIEKQLSEYEIRRAIMLLHYMWRIETNSYKTNIVNMFLSAKKMNAFSSVHYKLH